MKVSGFQHLFLAAYMSIIHGGSTPIFFVAISQRRAAAWGQDHLSGLFQADRVSGESFEMFQKSIGVYLFTTWCVIPMCYQAPKLCDIMEEHSFRLLHVHLELEDQGLFFESQGAHRPAMR